jgi:hypothetical protein
MIGRRQVRKSGRTISVPSAFIRKNLRPLHFLRKFISW